MKGIHNVDDDKIMIFKCFTIAFFSIYTFQCLQHIHLQAYAVDVEHTKMCTVERGIVDPDIDSLIFLPFKSVYTYRAI